MTSCRSVVFCLEGRSWRKDFTSYKRNRQETRDAIPQAEEDKVFWEVFDEFQDSLVAKQIVQ